MTDADTDKQELLRLNAEYRRCIVQRDVEGFDWLLADDYFVIGPDGERVENKEDRLNHLKEPGNVTEYLELSDAAVHVYGDSGVVHGVVTSGGTFEGRPFTDRGRDACWYVKRERFRALPRIDKSNDTKGAGPRTRSERRQCNETARRTSPARSADRQARSRPGAAGRARNVGRVR